MFSADIFVKNRASREQLHSTCNCKCALNKPLKCVQHTLRMEKKTSIINTYLPSALRDQQPEILAPEYAGSVFMTGQTDEMR